MILCSCEGVTDREIEQVIRDGARTVDAIGERCGAGTGCGHCRCDLVQLIVEAEQAERQGAPWSPLVPVRALV